MLTREDKLAVLLHNCERYASRNDVCGGCPIREDCRKHSGWSTSTPKNIDKLFEAYTEKCCPKGEEVSVTANELTEAVRNELLKDRTFVRSILYGLIDMIDYYNRITRLPDCNDCGKRSVCKYIPEPGEHVRINCPLWSEEKV